MGLDNSFLFYAIMCVIAIVVVRMKFIETRGKSLEEIELDLQKAASN
jgi:hypothetical protein